MARGRARSSPKRRVAMAAFPPTRPTSPGWVHRRRLRRSSATPRPRSRPGWPHSPASSTKRWCARSPARRASTRIWRSWQRPRRSRGGGGAAPPLRRRWQTQLLAQAGELLDKLGAHLCFFFIGEKRDIDGIERDALQAVGVIAPVPGQDQKLVGQRCAEERWVIGVHRHQYPRLVQRPEWVVGEAGHHARAEVAGRAELEGDAV